MRTTPARTVLALLLALAFAALSGCTNPDAPARPPAGAAGGSLQGPGEAGAPPPPTPESQSPQTPAHSPTQALERFALLYTNWTYATLGERQRTLAAISIGAARLSEQQAAAASAADSTIRQGRIANSGALITIGRDLARPGLWCVVTREQTSGSGYQGIQAAYHVTLARLAHLHDGWAVSEWLPQS